MMRLQHWSTRIGIGATERGCEDPHCLPLSRAVLLPEKNRPLMVGQHPAVQAIACA